MSIGGNSEYEDDFEDDHADDHSPAKALPEVTTHCFTIVLAEIAENCVLC